MRNRILIAAMILALCGCETLLHKGPELERARAAVAVATASIPANLWQGDLPLIGPTNGEPADPPPFAGVPSENDSAVGSGDRDFYTPPEPDDTGTTAAAESIQWQSSFKAAIESARESERVLWVHIVHAGCGPCEKLRTGIFRDAAFVSAVNRQLVAVQVDRAKGDGPAVVDVYETGGSDPVDLFILPGGQFVRYYGAPPSTDEYLARIANNERYAGTKHAHWPSYPNDGNRPWTLNGKRIGASHVLNHAKHRDKFPAAWVESLSSTALQQLHADDHENDVQWEFVPRNK